MALEDTLDYHHDCEVVIIPRFHKGKFKLIPGLYCCNHATLIKWLTPQQSQECQRLGVELLAPVHEDKMSLLKQDIKLRYKPYAANKEQV